MQNEKRHQYFSSPEMYLAYYDASFSVVPPVRAENQHYTSCYTQEYSKHYYVKSELKPEAVSIRRNIFYVQLLYKIAELAEKVP